VASLQESKNRYRTLFDSAGGAIAIHDMKGKFLEVSRALCERLGYSRGEPLQMTTADTGSSGYASIEAGHGEELRRLCPSSPRPLLHDGVALSPSQVGNQMTTCRSA